MVLAAGSSLRGLVAGYADYWERTGAFTTRRELPHPEGVLIVNLGEPIRITGGDGGVLTLAPGEAFVAGAHLKPALSHSLPELAARVVPLKALLGGEAREVGAGLLVSRDREARAGVLDEALGRRLSRTAPLDRRQLHALELLRTHPEHDIASEVGWSGKHLRARIHDAAGVGPRCYRRLLRFRALTRAVAAEPGAPDWAGLALDAGYCDQAHMIRDFREFSGLTPGAYLAQSLPDGGGLVQA